MEIRKMRPADAEDVFAMMEVFYASEALLIHPNQEVLRKTLEDCLADGPYLEGYVFEEDGILAGYAMVAKSYSTEAGGKCIWIEDLYLSPDYRRKGAGTAFLTFIAQRYAGQAVRLRLEAEPENDRALGTYRSAGFEVLGYTQLVKTLE